MEVSVLNDTGIKELFDKVIDKCLELQEIVDG
jgi:hypothetical protein